MPRAREFSLQYLDLIQDYLHIQSDETGRLVYNAALINEFTVKKLIFELHDLLKSSVFDHAKTDFGAYGRGENDKYKIQTTAVGYADDFDLLIKLGVIMGDRTVLWDSVFYSVLMSREIDLLFLGDAAITLLELRPLIEADGACLLPHPITWLERAQRYFKPISTIPNIGTDIIGFVNAIALTDEGYTVHPYIYQSDPLITKRLHSLLVTSERFSSEKLDEHILFQNILEDKNVVIFREKKAIDFYNAVKNVNGLRATVYEELHEMLTPRPGMSPEEKAQKYNSALVKLNEFVDCHNSDMVKYYFGAGSAFLGAVGSTFATLNGYTEMAIITLLAGSLGSIGTFFNKLISRPEEPPIIQFFHKIKESAEERFIKDINSPNM